MKDKELEGILEEISGIFDYAYSEADSDEDRDYICDVESRLFNYLKNKRLIEEDK